MSTHVKAPRGCLLLLAVLGSMFVAQPVAGANTGLDGVSCIGRPATILGTDGPDLIYGTNGDDVIVALGGDDTIYGRQGNDIICAGEGDDRVWGGSGRNIVYGENGNDRIRTGDNTGSGGRTTISGGPGDDILKGGHGRDSVNGDDGNDRIRGSKGDDVVHGGEGDDVLWGGPGDDRVFGYIGTDILKGGTGIDQCAAGSGEDDYGRTTCETLHGAERADPDARMVDRINTLRGNAGLELLEHHAAMSDLAQVWATTMANQGATSPNPNLPAELDQVFGAVDDGGQNIRRSTAGARGAQAFFDRDEASMANTMAPEATDVGIGIVTRDGWTYVAQYFVNRDSG